MERAAPCCRISPANRTLTYILFALTLVAIALMCRRLSRNTGYEGFDPLSGFVAKRDGEIYDAFYAGVYDSLYIPDQHANLIHNVLSTTYADPATSVMMDVGSGTGTLTAAIAAKGYRICGVERSREMAAHSLLHHPEVSVDCDDVANTMLFEKQVFSHIVCLNMTIYEMRDKVAFFRNCYFWLKLNGYLIVHMVDTDRYDPIVSVAKKGLADDNLRMDTSGEARVTDTEVDFLSYKYTRTTEFVKTETIITETFAESANIRKNYLVLKTESIPEIISMAKQSGFHAVGFLRGANGDAYQYLYVFERVM